VLQKFMQIRPLSPNRKVADFDNVSVHSIEPRGPWETPVSGAPRSIPAQIVLSRLEQTLA
jgi:hypothetical protein